MTATSVRQRGFSFLELIVTLAIGAILLGLALPSFRSLLGDSHMAATTNDLVYALQTARSESIKRAGPVALCPSTNSTTLNPGCGGGYADGWIVYADLDGNGARNGSEPVLLQAEKRSGAFAFTPDAQFASRVYFGDTGASTNPAGVPLSGRIAIDYASGTEQREVIIAANGRISSEIP